MWNRFKINRTYIFKTAGKWTMAIYAVLGLLATFVSLEGVLDAFCIVSLTDKIIASVIILLITYIRNYSAFYVATPFNPCNLGANATPDFVYYNTLKAWKGKDTSFPFLDAHGTTYNVRDNSTWDTLKERLHERLRNSKNIILFLSSNTKYSQALKEELDYGINVLGLPVFRDNCHKVPTAHVPLDKDYITKALNDKDFTIQSKGVNYCWCY